MSGNNDNIIYNYSILGLYKVLLCRVRVDIRWILCNERGVVPLISCICGFVLKNAPCTVVICIKVKISEKYLVISNKITIFVKQTLKIPQDDKVRFITEVG